jgi:serine/threonine protein kinase
MGVVFKAEDPDLQRVVALKVMLPRLAVSASARQRFLREARAAAALSDDHIVHVYQVGEDRGIPYLAMQLLKGEPLEALLRRQPRLSVTEALRIGREIAEGLAVAHEHGLIHRDIKPANIWLEPIAGQPAGHNGRVKILDFGLARAVSGDLSLTQSGAILGTPGYMAPEQSGKGADHRSDIFSLGCVLYRMTTGEAPFQAPEPVSMLVAVATQEPRPPHDLNVQIPGALERLILRMLAKDPMQRPQSAPEVVAELRALEGQQQGSVKIGALVSSALRLTQDFFARRRMESAASQKSQSAYAPAPPAMSSGHRPLRRISSMPLLPPPRRRRSRLLRVIGIVILGIILLKAAISRLNHSVGENPEQDFTVKIGDHKIVEYHAGGVPKDARRAADAYLKSKYPHHVVSEQEMQEPGHAVFHCTQRDGEDSECFDLHFKRNNAKGKWEFVKIESDSKD